MTNGAAPCDVIDATVTVSIGSSRPVAVCQINAYGVSSQGIEPIIAFNYRLLYDDSIITAPESANSGLGLDDNPDSNAGSTKFGPTNLGPFWDCTGSVGSFPVADEIPATGPGAGRAYSGGCLSALGPYTLGQSGVLQVITFVGSSAGSSSLAFTQATLTDDQPLQFGSCNPVQEQPMACVGGTINVVQPTPTPTNTPDDPELDLVPLRVKATL
jgi:hypothetical protein